MPSNHFLPKEKKILQLKKKDLLLQFPYYGTPIHLLSHIVIPREKPYYLYVGVSFCGTTTLGFL